MTCKVNIRFVAHPNPDEAIRVVATVFLREWERTHKALDTESPHLLNPTVGQLSEMHVGTKSCSEIEQEAIC